MEMSLYFYTGIRGAGFAMCETLAVTAPSQAFDPRPDPRLPVSAPKAEQSYRHHGGAIRKRLSDHPFTKCKAEI